MKRIESALDSMRYLQVMRRISDIKKPPEGGYNDITTYCF